MMSEDRSNHANDAVGFSIQQWKMFRHVNELPCKICLSIKDSRLNATTQTLPHCLWFLQKLCRL